MTALTDAVRAQARVEAEILLRHLAAYLAQHELLIPELTVTAPGGIEARLSLKRLPPAPSK